MQIEKFYLAQTLITEKLDLEAVLAAINDPIEIKVLDKLTVEIQKQLKDKASDIIKKELAKFIKQKEKEFNDL